MPKSKLSKDDIETIRRMDSAGWDRRDIAAEYNVSLTRITDICNSYTSSGVHVMRKKELTGGYTYDMLREVKNRVYVGMVVIAEDIIRDEGSRRTVQRQRCTVTGKSRNVFVVNRGKYLSAYRYSDLVCEDGGVRFLD